MTEEPRFGPHRHDSNDTNDHSPAGSRSSGIDRLAEADKQLRIVMQDTDSEWAAAALEAIRDDLARVRGDGFQRASELHDGIRAHREGQR
jgi:hypothetical protein